MPEHRNTKIAYDMTMTQPLVFDDHVDLATRDLLSQVRISGHDPWVLLTGLADAGSRPRSASHNGADQESRSPR